MSLPDPAGLREGARRARARGDPAGKVRLLVIEALTEALRAGMIDGAELRRRQDEAYEVIDSVYAED